MLGDYIVFAAELRFAIEPISLIFAGTLAYISIIVIKRIIRKKSNH
jgi:hypothetical protein